MFDNLLVFFLGAVFGTLLLPAFMTTPAPYPDTPFFFAPSNSICYPGMTPPGPWFSTTQIWIIMILFCASAIVSFLQVLLRIRPEYLDAFFKFSCHQSDAWGRFFRSEWSQFSRWLFLQWAPKIDLSWIYPGIPAFLATIIMAWHAFSLQLLGQWLIVVPALTQRIADLEGEIANRDEEIAKHERKSTSTALRIQNADVCTRNLASKNDSADQIIAVLRSEVEILRADKVVKRTQAERGELERRIRDQTEQLATEKAARVSADWWAKYHQQHRLRVEGKLKAAEQRATTIHAELAEAREAAAKFHANSLLLASRYRDVRELDVFRETMHACAETRGDKLTAAILFALEFRRNGGNLHALGVCPERFRAMERFVLDGQSPAAGSQPTGLR